MCTWLAQIRIHTWVYIWTLLVTCWILSDEVISKHLFGQSNTLCRCTATAHLILMNLLTSIFHQNTAEAPHQEQCCLWEAFYLQTLLLVCAHRRPVPFWPGGSSCALPVDLPHHRSSRRDPWRTPGSHRLSGKLSYYTSDLHHIFILQQKEEHRQHVNHQIHEEMYWPWAGRKTQNLHALFLTSVCHFSSLCTRISVPFLVNIIKLNGAYYCLKWS